jgi:OmcA/MtrC family decaheme c-type cytochrome
VKLGANPSFHAGPRNDGQSCAFCHRPNQTSSGWSANAKDFIHGIHGAAKRTNPFTWHAVSATENFSEVTFPGAANDCTACHKPNTFDFTASANLAALPNMLWSTAAAGSFKTTDATSYAYSPYIAQDGTAYGAAFSFNAGTGVTTPAAATTLVTSPITAACVACHDAPSARDHMQANGGSFYAPRTVIGLSQ